MREITDSDQLFNGMEPGDVAVMLSEDDARTIGLALNIYNQKLVAEFEKIQNTPDVSELIVNAAHQNYQRMTLAGTKLHTELAGVFPVLRQGGISAD